MRWPTALKVTVVFALLLATILTLWYGVVYFIFGVAWGRLGGAFLIGLGIYLFIKTLDLSLGRPPQFSKAPWERPWEDQ